MSHMDSAARRPIYYYNRHSSLASVPCAGNEVFGVNDLMQHAILFTRGSLHYTSSATSQQLSVTKSSGSFHGYRDARDAVGGTQSILGAESEAKLEDGPQDRHQRPARCVKSTKIDRACCIGTQRRPPCWTRPRITGLAHVEVPAGHHGTANLGLRACTLCALEHTGHIKGGAVLRNGRYVRRNRIPLLVLLVKPPSLGSLFLRVWHRGAARSRCFRQGGWCFTADGCLCVNVQPPHCGAAAGQGHHDFSIPKGPVILSF
eukprot:1886075-Amphidinium_carterae.1